MSAFTFKNVIQYASMVILITGIIGWTANTSNKKTAEMTPYAFEIRLPKAISGLFFFCFMFFGAALILAATFLNNESAVWWVYLIFGILAFGSLLAGIFTLRRRVVVQGDLITIYPMIGQAQNCHFSQITHTVYHPKPYPAERMIKVYSGSKKLFSFSVMYTGHTCMCQRLIERRLL